MNADESLPRNTPTGHNEYVGNKNKLENVDDVSFRELFVSIMKCFIYKIRYVPSKNSRFLYLHWPFFSM